MIEHLEDSLLGDYLPTLQYDNDLKNPKFLQLKSILKKAEESLKDILPNDLYQIKNRTGQFKNIALCPWIGIHSRQNEYYQNAQEGIYLTLLWKVDGSGICVSLQIGTNSQKPNEIRPRTLSIINSWGLSTFSNEIDLASSFVEKPRSRPWAYEQANIEGKEYDLDSLAEITNDLPVFLNNYESLIEQRENGELIYQGWKFSFNAKKPKGSSSKSKKREIGETEVTHLHIDLQKALFEVLVSKYGIKNVDSETEIIPGKFADLVVRLESGNFEIYEIKTKPTARKCIREALGQILEYSYWPGSPIVEKMWIVGPASIDDDSSAYLNTIKEEFAMPIEYIHQSI
ncbi:DUF3578 domain-containing protein [Opitutales bacterium]|nr:DUF3578 domain-containing protein [Opitutales bacterium]